MGFNSGFKGLIEATLHRVFLLQKLPLKINTCLRLLWVFYVLVLYFHKVLERNMNFALKFDSDAPDYFAGPN